jgi:multidrug efflux pump
MAPPEDRGSFFVMLQAPEGTSFSHMVAKMKQAEGIFYELLERGEADRVLVRVPGTFGSSEDYTRGFSMIMLTDWSKRERSSEQIMAEINGKLQNISDVRGYAMMPQGFQSHGGSSQPIQFVLSGTDYDKLAEWRDIVINKLSQDARFIRPNSDYLETRPELQVDIDHERASDLGVTVSTIGRTLEAMMGTRRVTTFVRDGEEYDVILQARDEDRAEPNDLTNIFVRSDRTGRLIPLSNLIDVSEKADAGTRRHFNRLRSITVSAGLAPGVTLGEALTHLEQIAKQDLPGGVVTDFKGESANYKESQSSLFFTFGMALLVVFLVLAAQFESLVHPIVIMTTVPLAVAGGLFGLFAVGSSLNVYSIIGMVILIGLSAKNGILIVEFANQLRDEGVAFKEALLKASETRLRPILMTGASTSIGSLPLILSIGPGAGSRLTIGIVIFCGVLFATFLTLFVVPVFYNLLGRNTKSPGTIAKILNSYETEASLEQSVHDSRAEQV